MQQGLLLFAHGARDANWALPFEAVLERVRVIGADGKPPLQVRLGFLEFMQPDLLGAGASLVAAGCAVVDVVPLFLGAGGHVRKDLPRLLAELASRHPDVTWRLRPAVGEMPAVIEAMAMVSAAWIDAATPAIDADRTAVDAPGR